jgi:hypothetical protein
MYTQREFLLKVTEKLNLQVVLPRPVCNPPFDFFEIMSL